MQPTELSIGTSEARKPTGSHWHRPRCGSVYLHRPGGATYARSWLPSSGGYQGLLMTHDEVFSIADYLSLRQGTKFEYRPTVMFVYHPCDDAMLSTLELEGRGWSLQPTRRIIRAEIVTGMDELGVLIAGHAKNAYWFGSQLSIAEARRHVPYTNATCLQVAAGALGATDLGDPQPARGPARGGPARLPRSAGDRAALPRIAGGRLHGLDTAAGPRGVVQREPGGRPALAAAERLRPPVAFLTRGLA